MGGPSVGSSGRELEFDSVGEGFFGGMYVSSGGAVVDLLKMYWLWIVSS